jgi:hypothetical protein
MKKEECLAWFEEILAKCPKPYTQPARRLTQTHVLGPSDFIHANEAYAWIAEAGSAIGAAIPEGWDIRILWNKKMALVSGSATPTPFQIKELRGIVEGAVNLIRGNRLVGLVDSIRVETESELLDQAEQLRSKSYLAAAAVIAGGTLEVHLRRLCDKNTIAFSGNGSISAYKQALDQSRNSGKEIISSIASGHVDAWGKLRNAAAHQPDKFESSADEVRRMIEGIREFVDRHQ